MGERTNLVAEGEAEHEADTQSLKHLLSVGALAASSMA